jgi:hypothetical protein
MTFDPAKTSQLRELSAVAVEQRDDDWRRRFVDLVRDAALVLTASEPMTGPDGFTYLVLEYPPPDRELPATSVTQLAAPCTERGCGLVINPGGGPDWVFTYGDLWALRQHGDFQFDDPEPFKGRLAAGDACMFGAPADEFFPPWARSVVRSYLQHTGLAEPKVLLLNAPSLKPAFNLVFNIFPDDFASAEPFQKFMRRLRWYFPRTRGVVTLSRAAASESLTPL